MDQYVDAVANGEVESRMAAAAAAGTKRSSYERDKELILDKRRKCNYWEEEEDEDVFEMPVVGAKRGYERDEVESDVIFTKRYKCNYWEDPTKARQLEREGGRLAEMAAQDNDTDRFMPEMHAWILAYAASGTRE